MEITNVIVLLIQLATPFAVVYINYRNNKINKEREHLTKLEREVADNKRKELNDTMNAAIQSLNNAKLDIETLFEDSEKTSVMYHKMAKSILLNGNMTSELAQLVTALAEGLRDQHLNGNITAAVNKYRKFEQTTVGSLATGGLDEEKR